MTTKCPKLVPRIGNTVFRVALIAVVSTADYPVFFSAKSPSVTAGEDSIGILSLVATPIGNLSDLSPRACEILGSSDLIACEDTRVTKKLLDHLSFSKTLVSYREENEVKRQRNWLICLSRVNP